LLQEVEAVEQTAGAAVAAAALKQIQQHHFLLIQIIPLLLVAQGLVLRIHHQAMAHKDQAQHLTQLQPLAAAAVLLVIKMLQIKMAVLVPAAAGAELLEKIMHG
jgi:hypothetical protein